MRLSINIEKKYAFMILGTILLGIGGFFVYAVVPNPGHSDGEIESVSWSKITSRPAGLDDGDQVGMTSVSWAQISGRPAGLDDGDQVGITSETDPTVPASVKDGIVNSYSSSNCQWINNLEDNKINRCPNGYFIQATRTCSGVKWICQLECCRVDSN